MVAESIAFVWFHHHQLQPFEVTTSTSSTSAADDSTGLVAMDSAERTLNPPPVHHADGTPSAAHVSLSALTPGHVGRKLRLIGQ